MDLNEFPKAAFFLSKSNLVDTSLSLVVKKDLSKEVV